MRKNIKEEGTYLYFQREDGGWDGPVKIRNEEDFNYLVYEHRNFHYKWLKVTYRNDTPEYESGLLEPDPGKRKKKKM